MKKVLRKISKVKMAAMLIIAANFLSINGKAQSPCNAATPSFTINLTGSSDSVWASPNVPRNSTCCATTSPDKCIYFNLTLDPNAAGIQIDMIGADPAGSLFYDIGCVGNYPGGSIKCISGVGPHLITFCKPGSNKNIYVISSISKPLFPKDDTTRIGCKKKLIVKGVTKGSVIWAAISGTSTAQNTYFNTFLDSVNIATPTYSPLPGAPPYIDYQVCGFPQASMCGFSVTVCDTVRVYNYPALTGVITPSPATFCNTGPGSGVTLTLTPSGGLAPYSYIWTVSPSTVTAGTNSTYSATANGVYNVTLKDKLYNPGTCSAFFTSISVSQGTLPVVDAGPSQKVCSSNPITALSGTVQYAPGGIWSGGTGTFTPGNNYLNTSYLPSPAELSAGFVTLYLTSSGNGSCATKTDSLKIYYPAQLTASVSSAMLPCFNTTTAITSTVTGGTLPYSYFWSTGSTATSITGGQGNYSLYLTDSLGCKTQANYNLVSPTALNIIFNVTNVTINGGNNGTASVTVSGGTAPYTVTWTPGSMNTFSIGGLVYGIYTAVITDANGCQIAGSVVVNEPRCSAFNAVTSATYISCNGANNGVASVTVTGGAPTYTYSWNTSPVQTTPTATNLPAGVVTCVITDTNNCLQTANVVITEPTALTSIMSYTNVTIIGGNNGAASVNAFGGTPPYTYQWNFGPTTQSVSGLAAGFYTVTVTDANGCTRTDNVLITQPPCNALNINIVQTNINCYGGTTGSALAVISGATGSYTISWSTGAFGPSITNLAAGNYSVMVTDSKNCSQIMNFSIIQPPQLSIGVLPTGVSCNGFANGSINITVTGGIYPYTFLWGNGSNSEDLVNLGPGTYSVVITDANGCSAVGSAVISQPSPLAVTYTTQNVSCIYGNNGAIGLNVTGGTVPFTYTWSTGATSSSVSGLTAGGYTVSVKDANGCLSAQPLIIPLVQPDSVLVDSFIVACSVPGSGQTQVTIIPAGGYSGTYQVSYNNGLTFQAAGVYIAMLNNNTTYSIVLKDGNNCLSLKPDILTIKPEVKIDSVSYFKCYTVGTTTTQIVVYPSGGDGGPYQASFNNGSTYQAAGNYTLNATVANSYTVIVKDTRGCVSAIQIITLPSVLNASVSVTSSYNGQDISCFGSTDGSAAVIASGGTGLYTYSWTSVPTQTNASAVNLGAGTYSVIVKDGNNCSVTKTVTLTQPSVISATAIVISNFNGQNISCFGSADGSASVTVTGATSPYTYNWSSNPTQTTSVAVNLSAGVYSVIVMDANGCAVTKTVNLTQPPAITATAVVTSNYNGQNISCFGLNNGSASVNAASGTAPYTFTWSTIPVQTGSVAINLTAGNYSVVVADANGCSITQTVTLTQPSQIAATTSVTSNYNGQNISCFGLNDGSALVTPTGGTSPFTYSWTTVPTQTTSSAINIGAGTYSVIVTDINGCSVTKTVSLTQPNALTPVVISVSNYNGYNVSCFGDINGSIDISINGGTGVYTYSWSNSATTQDINNIGAGVYSVVATDANGCKGTLTVNITQPNPILVNIISLSNFNGYNVSCFASTNGSVTLSVSGGVPGYTYLWSNGATNQNLSNIGSGYYYLSITDLNSCNANIDTTLIQPAPLANTYTVSQPLCNGVSNGSVNITLTGGVNPITYNWSNGATTEDINNITAGTYTVTSTDANGCQNATVINVNQPQNFVFSKETSNVKCYGDTTGYANITLSGGTVPYTYSWSNGANTQDIGPVTGGTYILTVTDANSCVLKDTTNITEPPPIRVGIYSPTYSGGYNISTYNGNDGSIDLSVSGGTSPYSYIWSNGATTQDINNLTAFFPNPFPYSVVITDANGCLAKAMIELIQPTNLEMPTAYSPNNDGKNDNFIVHGIEIYQDNVLTIFNRWGNIVYTKNGYFNEWDGYSSNGEALPDGTYFAFLEINNGEIVLKGYVELRR